MIKKLIENSLNEWENRVSAIIIFGGCNLRCGFCHGTEFLEAHEPYLSISTVINKLKKNKDWLDGIVLSGGEVTIANNLTEVCQAIKDELELHIKIHTNGTNENIVLNLLKLKLIDCLSLDYKALLSDENYWRILGIDKKSEDFIKKNIKGTFDTAKSLAESNFEVEYHTTIIPKIMDLPYFSKMSDELEPNGRWILQQFNNEFCYDDAYKKVKPYSLSELDDYEITARIKHNNVIMRK